MLNLHFEELSQRYEFPRLNKIIVTRALSTVPVNFVCEMIIHLHCHIRNSADESLLTKFRNLRDLSFVAFTYPFHFLATLKELDTLAIEYPEEWEDPFGSFNLPSLPKLETLVILFNRSIKPVAFPKLRFLKVQILTVQMLVSFLSACPQLKCVKVFGVDGGSHILDSRLIDFIDLIDLTSLLREHLPISIHLRNCSNRFITGIIKKWREILPDISIKLEVAINPSCCGGILSKLELRFTSAGWTPLTPKQQQQWSGRRPRTKYEGKMYEVPLVNWTRINKVLEKLHEHLVSGSGIEPRKFLDIPRFLQIKSV
jgi:hypothetical protein